MSVGQGADLSIGPGFRTFVQPSTVRQLGCSAPWLCTRAVPRVAPPELFGPLVVRRRCSRGGRCP
eukprot:2869794-Alexandrium_andersonii.AAC.1